MKWSVIYIEIAELHESTETRQERLQIPWWNKYTLSVQEAAQYFGFSDKKIRKIVDEHENADFVLWNGSSQELKESCLNNMLIKN